MTREEMLEKQNVIYTIALDQIWDNLYDEEKDRLEWIWEQMESELNTLQNENAGRVLKQLFDKWGHDNRKN